MKIAVLSGKGGAGKTFVAVNLAAAVEKAVYIDCDVEEPNGRIFLKPEISGEESVNISLPRFDDRLCDGCRLCVENCRFHALVLVNGKPMLFPEVCHSCGLCGLVCPRGAVSEKEKPVGALELGKSGNVSVITGRMNIGEASGVPLIKAALRYAGAADGLTLIDCPPGSACPVMECVRNADYCLLVAEPTAFGAHNFEMVYELACLFKKPCGAVFNKVDTAYQPLENFCRDRGIPVLCRIPYSEALARSGARGELAAENEGKTAEIFKSLLSRIREENGA